MAQAQDNGPTEDGPYDWACGLTPAEAGADPVSAAEEEFLRVEARSDANLLIAAAMMKADALAGGLEKQLFQTGFENTVAAVHQSDMARLTCLLQELVDRVLVSDGAPRPGAVQTVVERFEVLSRGYHREQHTFYKTGALVRWAECPILTCANDREAIEAVQ